MQVISPLAEVQISAYGLERPLLARKFSNDFEIPAAFSHAKLRLPFDFPGPGSVLESSGSTAEDDRGPLAECAAGDFVLSLRALLLLWDSIVAAGVTCKRVG